MINSQTQGTHAELHTGGVVGTDRARARRALRLALLTPVMIAIFAALACGGRSGRATAGDTLATAATADTARSATRSDSVGAPYAMVGYTCGPAAAAYRFVVTFADDSARVELPGARELMLPAVRGASGARYGAAGVMLQAKGGAKGEALLERGDTIFTHCRATALSSPWEAAHFRGVDFRGIGQEPGWYVEIHDGERIDFVGDYGDRRASMPAPAPATDPAGRITYDARSDAHRLRITIEHRECADGMSDERFTETVTVDLDGKRYEGCGRKTDRGPGA